ncbi:hypothetical protein Tco_1384446 [Tanacetum coccineum]
MRALCKVVSVISWKALGEYGNCFCLLGNGMTWGKGVSWVIEAGKVDEIIEGGTDGISSIWTGEGCRGIVSGVGMEEVAPGFAPNLAYNEVYVVGVVGGSSVEVRDETGCLNEGSDSVLNSMLAYHGSSCFSHWSVGFVTNTFCHGSRDCAQEESEVGQTWSEAWKFCIGRRRQRRKGGTGVRVKGVLGCELTPGTLMFASSIQAASLGHAWVEGYLGRSSAGWREGGSRAPETELTFRMLNYGLGLFCEALDSRGRIDEILCESSNEFMQRFIRIAGFLGQAAGTAEEQAKNFRWGLHKSILDRILCMEFTDVAQVADAARNFEILRDRDD